MTVLLHNEKRLLMSFHFDTDAEEMVRQIGKLHSVVESDMVECIIPIPSSHFFIPIPSSCFPNPPCPYYFTPILITIPHNPCYLHTISQWCNRISPFATTRPYSVRFSHPHGIRIIFKHPTVKLQNFYPYCRKCHGFTRFPITMSLSGSIICPVSNDNDGTISV